MITRKDNIFVLETKNTHYVLGVDKYGYNRHIHWGKKCDVEDYFIKEGRDENSNHSMLDDFKQEYTPFGKTMYRGSAIKAEFADGCREINLKFDGYDIDGNTLKIDFTDVFYPLAITLTMRFMMTATLLQGGPPLKITAMRLFALKSYLALNLIYPQKSHTHLKIQTAHGVRNFLKPTPFLKEAHSLTRAEKEHRGIISRRISLHTKALMKKAEMFILQRLHTAVILRLGLKEIYSAPQELSSE